MRRPILCICILGLVLVAPPLDAQSPSGGTVRASLPGKSWSVMVDLPGFEFNANETKPDGRRYVIGQNEKTGVVFSVTLERVSFPADAEECRKSLNRRAEGARAQPSYKDIRLSESGEMAVLEYVIEEIGGRKLRQGNLFACVGVEDVFVDYHFSKVSYGPADRKLFDAILRTAHIEEGGEGGVPSEPPEIRKWKDEVTKNPNDANARIALGDAYGRNSVAPQAIEQYQAAARLNPALVLPHLRLGATHMFLANWPDAAKELREAVRLAPNDPDPYLLLGMALIFGSSKDAETLDDAQKQFVRFLQLVPPGAENGQHRGVAYFQLGVIHKQMGREAEAAQAYEQGLKENPTDPEIWNNFAWLLATARDIKVRNSQRAVELAQKAVAAATQQRQVAYLDTLGEAYYANGQFEQAVETERKAIGVDPENEDLKQQLKKFEEALAASKK